MVCDGKTNHEIAENLKCSSRTVETKLKIIYRLFDVKNRTGLIIKAIRNNIV